MKIIERAERYACDELSECRDDVRDAYIQGATDQRKIDVDRACEWLGQNLWTFTYTKHGETNYDVDLAVERFRQAMMED